MSIRKVTSSSSDSAYIRALEKELAARGSQLDEVLGRVKSLEQRPRPELAEQKRVPAAPESLKVKSSMTGGSASVATAFGMVTYDTKGAPINIDRHELQGRIAPSKLAQIPGAVRNGYNRATSGDFSVIAQYGNSTLGPKWQWGSTFTLSEDHGATWREVGGISGQTFRDMKISVDGQTITGISYTTAAVIRSTNGGLTWSKQPQGNLPLGGSILGLTVSLDGLCLTMMRDFFTQYLFNGVLYNYWMGAGSTAVVTNSKLWASTDGGLTWIEGGSVAQSGFGIVMSSSTDGRVVISGIREPAPVGSQPSVSISTDYGMSWTLSYPGISVPSAEYGTALHPSISPDGTRVILSAYSYGDYASIYASSVDNGATWTTLPATTFTQGGDTVQTDGTIYTLGSQGGVTGNFRSANGGASWSEWTPILPAAGAGGIWAVSSNNAHEARLWDHFSVSHSAGMTWSTFYAPGVRPTSSPVISRDGTRISVFGADRGLYVSTNGGRNWTQRYGKNATWYASFHAESGDGTRIVALDSNDGGIVVSVDSGLAYTYLANPPLSDSYQASGDYRQWVGVECSSDGATIVVAAEDGVWTSRDFGETWTAGTGLSSYIYSITSTADCMMLVAITDDSNMFASFDAGLTWTLTSGYDPSSMDQEVTITADGGLIMLAEYPGLMLQGTFPLGETTWRSLGSCPGDDNAIEYWPLPAGQTWEFRVRAVSTRGISGINSATASLVLAH